jgi:hypothetical protein
MRKGKCYICNDIYSDSGLARHIKSCLIKTKDAKTNNSNISNATYLIKVQDKYDSGYYLYLMVDGCVLLSELDQYLRDIWLECCGHLSSFKIDEINYERYPDPGWGDREGMDIEIEEVLDFGMFFSYMYDYGSTTELELKVMGIYQPLFSKKGIYLIGRNLPREYKCENCDNKAEFQYFNMRHGEQGIVCNSCMEKMESENTKDDDIYFSDIINSPRAGVCGYDGPTDDILFMEHREIRKSKKGNRKEAAREPNERLTANDRLTLVEKLLSGQLTEEDVEEQGEDFLNVFYKIANLARYRQRSMPPFMIERYKLDGHMLKDYLNSLRKKELDVIRKSLNIEKASGLKKDELVDCISQFLLDNIENILMLLPSLLYKIIQEIHKEGEAFWVNDEDVPQPIIDLRNKGLLFTVWEDEEEFECVIPEDIKLILEELKENLEFQKKRKFANEISKAIISVFYYWGIVQKYDLKKETARLLGIETDNEFTSLDDEFTTFFEDIFKNMENYMRREIIGSNVYYYMFVEDAGDKIISPEWQNADYPLISKGMVPEEYEGGLSLVLHSPYLRWICEIMLEKGQAENEDEEIDNEEEAYGLVSHIAEIASNMKPGTDVRELAKELEMPDTVLTAPFIKEFLNNLLLYTPNYWIKGNSISGEIHVRNEQYKEWKPKTLYPKSSVKSRKKNPVGVAASKWKVGRNDPCPCGSGKKYKSCCGK